MKEKVIRCILTVLTGILTAVLFTAAEPVRAEEADEVITGECGEDARWSYEDGVLTISGSGAMTASSDTYRSSIWKSCGKITEIVVEEGITEIGSFMRLELEKISLPQSLEKITALTFYGCTNLNDISIPDNAVTLERGCFSGCTSLKKISLPVGMKEIAQSCFSDCTGLTEITIPDGTLQLGDGCFSDCTSLTKIHIPDGMLQFGGRCFSGCTSLTKIHIPDGMLQFGWYCFSDCTSLLEINMPDSITEIGQRCFSGCKGLAKITVSDNITTISNECFYGCSGLTEITIPSKATELGSRCFYNCLSLQSVQFPESLITIGEEAFGNCAGIQSISLNSSLERLESEAFRNCTGLTEITLPPSLTFFNNPFSGCSNLSDVFYNVPNVDSYSKLLNGAGSADNLITLTLGDDVKTLPDGFLYDSKYVSKIKGGRSLTGIGKEAFFRCSSLTDITLPDTVTIIPEYAFCGCKSLKTVSLPKAVTSIGIYAFSGCTGLESVVFPQTLTSIGYLAFSGCSSLSSVTLPDTITELGTSVFQNCTSLEAFRFPQALTSVSNGIFAGCTKLSSVILPDALTGIEDYAFDGCTSLTALTLPQSLTSIKSKAFTNSGLKNIVIPDSVTSMGGYVFESCKSLESVTFLANIPYIGHNMCYGCTALTSVKLSAPVNKIYNQAFYGCSALTSVELPETLLEINESAFNGCSSLSEIHFPDTLTKIGKDAFRGCASLTELTIPQNVQAIGEHAFFRCGLKSITWLATACTEGESAFQRNTAEGLSVTIAEDVESLPDSLFFASDTLESVTFEGAFTWLGNSMFRSCSALASVSLPSALTDLPSGTFNSCSSLADITLPDTLESIGDSAFSGCSSLADITLPDTLESIGDFAFSGCSSLTKIKFPETVTSIGERAFSSCSSLTDASIGKSIQSLGRRCFSDCNLLPTKTQDGMRIYCDWIIEYSPAGTASLTIPEGVYGISDNAFYYQNSITAVSLPGTLRRIGKYAFTGCKNLSSVTGGANITHYDITAFDNTPWSTDSDYAILGNVLIRCSLQQEEITLPDTIERIAPGAFSVNHAIKKIHLPDSLTEIPAEAFSECENLIEISLPPSLKSIGEEAFYRTGLTSVELPENLTEIGRLSFAGCKSLTEIVIPASLNQIGNNAFSGSGLTSIHFAGREDMSLVEVSVHYGLRAFSGIPAYEDTILSWYTGRHFSLENKDGTSRLSMIARLMARSTMESGEVQNLRDAYDWLCSHCGYTTDVGYHYSYADGPFFYGVASCQGVALAMRAFLDEFELPNYMLFGVVDGDYGRRSHAWNQVCIGSTWYHIDATDTKKGDYRNYMRNDREWENLGNYTWDEETADRRQTEVLNAYIPHQENVTQPLTFTLQDDGTYHVTDCYMYQKGDIEIPAAYQGKPVTGIGKSAFANCYWLKNITIPEGIQSVGNGAFSGCIALEKLVFPSTLKELGSSAFTRCLLLNEVDLSAASIPEVDSGSFADTASLHVLRLPAMASVGSELFNWKPIINSLSGTVKLHIYGYTGSAAEALANENGYDFTSVGTMKEQTVTGIRESYTLYEGSNGITIEAVASAGGTLTYSSADESIAVVSEDGHIRPKGIGETEITVTAGRSGQYGLASATAKVTVIPRLPQEITGVEDSYSIYAGSEGVVLTASATGGGAITYTSKNSYVARITDDGHIMPVNAGTAEIEIKAAATEQYQKTVKTIQITVLPRQNLEDLQPEVTLTPATFTYDGNICRPDLTITLAGELLEANRDYTVSYPESILPGIYQVKIMGKNTYSGTVKAEYEVMKRPNSITGLQDSYTGIVGETLELHPITAGTCRFYSENKLIAYVGVSDNQIHFRSAGTTTFTVITYGTNTDEEARFTFTVTVQNKDNGSGGNNSGNGGSGSDGDSGGNNSGDGNGSGGNSGNGNGSGGSNSGSGNDSGGSNSGSGNGSGSNPSANKITRLAQPALQAPAIAAKGITVKWTPVPDASGYTIYRKLAKPNMAWARLASVSGNTASCYTDTSAAKGTLYSYTVQATYGTLKSTYDTTGRQALFLKAPKITKAKRNGPKKATVTWKKVSQAGGYQIQYSDSPAFKKAKTSRFSAAKKTGVISKLKKKKPCYIRIRAFRKESGKTWYSAYSKAKKIKP